MKNNNTISNVRKLAALDIAFLGPKFITNRIRTRRIRMRSPWPLFDVLRVLL